MPSAIIESIEVHVHWQCFLVKILVTEADYLPALATLGNATKNEMILSLSCLYVTGIIMINFTNGSMTLSS
jgi:hypothetical protein